MKEVGRRRLSRGGRDGRKARAAENKASARNREIYRRLRNPFPPIELLSEDQVDSIHRTSLTILEEIGLVVRLAEARRIFREAGADVDQSTEIVRLDRALVRERMAAAPARVTLHARNPEMTLEAGGNAVAFGTVGGPPNASDLERGRRAGSLNDFRDFMRLAQHYDVIHLLNPAVEPVDVAVPFRHIEMTHSMLTLTEKVPFIFARGSGQVADAMEMIRIAMRLTPDCFRETVCCYTVVNVNSPLQLDLPMSRGIIDFARQGQLVIVTPFTLAGAMAPISLAGALAQQNAEALAGMTLAQIVRPGVPVAYGGFTSNVDMKTGAPAFGTPEYVQAVLAGGQLARRYNVPYRSSNVNASNVPDAQAAYEAQMSLWSTMMGGCNLLMHAAGWLEGGLTASFEKFVIDVDMLQMFARLFQPLQVDNESLALDAVREVRHGGHFFGAAHTLARYDGAFYEPIVSDWRNYETWSEGGAPDAAARAHRVYKEVLAAFKPPAMDPAVRLELDEFAERRKREGGADLDD